ncbi:MAG: MFS transporter [Micromonosporaceae bacterium]|nr:MFS transporter [Micromonosporaceae bacterium]
MSKSVTTRTWSRVALALLGIGWGANQFAPMLLVYRAHRHLSEASVTAMFGVYALGLIPALVVAGPLADRKGRRLVMRPMVLLSMIATLLLMAGSAWPLLLCAGRFLSGVAAGAAIGAGSAWVKELSIGTAVGTGARRVTVALSAGFGGGPLAASLVAQWLPAPTVVPYLLHIGLMAVAVPAVWHVPDLFDPASAAGRPGGPHLPRAAFHPRFTRAVAPWAPWVFGTVTIAFAVIPTLATAPSGLPIAFSGANTGLTMLTGLFVQPFAKRLAECADGVAVTAGLATAAAGFGIGVLVAFTRNPWLVPLAALLLGGSYGLLLVSGLREVERLALPGELASLAAVFYSLTYVGFGAPYLFAVLTPHFGHIWCLLVSGVVVLTTVVPVLRTVRAHPVGGDDVLTAASLRRESGARLASDARQDAVAAPGFTIHRE